MIRIKLGRHIKIKSFQGRDRWRLERCRWLFRTLWFLWFSSDLFYILFREHQEHSLRRIPCRPWLSTWFLRWACWDEGPVQNAILVYLTCKFSSFFFQWLLGQAIRKISWRARHLSAWWFRRVRGWSRLADWSIYCTLAKLMCIFAFTTTAWELCGRSSGHFY